MPFVFRMTKEVWKYERKPLITTKAKALAKAV
jgi:hypothetical protein